MAKLATEPDAKGGVRLRQSDELMTNYPVKSLILATSLAAAAILSSCGSPPQETEVEQLELDTQPIEAPAAADNAEPAVAEVPAIPTDAPPVESVPLEPRSSEQSVQPDSETLFY